mmetsp:Transcript_12941/g.27406  ORF Transcript_12941/g.27406 Transcript_12941/m.27406 type:complete len:222 (+) Transcript_12941:1-666(+)
MEKLHLITWPIKFKKKRTQSYRSYILCSNSKNAAHMGSRYFVQKKAATAIMNATTIVCAISSASSLYADDRLARDFLRKLLTLAAAKAVLDSSLSNPFAVLQLSMPLEAKHTPSPLPFHSATVIDWITPCAASASASGSRPTKSSGWGATRHTGLRTGSFWYTSSSSALCRNFLLCKTRACLLRSPVPCVTAFRQTSNPGAARTSAVVPTDTPSTMPRKTG